MSIVHCKNEPYDVYIGRGRDPRSGEPGRWGNPFRIGRDGDREEVIARYAAWLHEEVDAERITLAELAALDGKALGCWCAPKPCHGEVLEQAAAWATRMLDHPNIWWDLRPSRRGGRMVGIGEGGDASDGRCRSSLQGSGSFPDGPPGTRSSTYRGGAEETPSGERSGR